MARVTGCRYRGRVKRIAITGGIGAGKSAVSEHLASLGYAVVDADLIARDVTRTGQPAWRALRDAFGDAVLGEDSSLDRAFLAAIVFNDATALRRLNLITHGPIGREIVRQLNEAGGDVVFLAIPLYRPESRSQFGIDEAWAVQVEPATALRRLRELRGLSQDDAKARLASQLTNEERSRIADRVLWNEGTLGALYAQVDEALHDSGVARG